MLVVVALGGNAIAPRGEPLTIEGQADRIARAASVLAGIAREHDLVITHGNGPQVGLLARQSESLSDVGALPLDVLGAETEGMIGYLLTRALRGRLPRREVACLLTQVEVDAADPAFDRPTKPIGRVHSADEAEQRAREAGWTFVEQATGGFRRVVASPEPTAIVELEVIRLLVATRVVVTCAGGGGIPVRRASDGTFHGVEAVIDKDAASALLADRPRRRSAGVADGPAGRVRRLARPDFPTDPSRDAGRAPWASLRGGNDGAQGRGGVSLRDRLESTRLDRSRRAGRGDSRRACGHPCRVL